MQSSIAQRSCRTHQLCAGSRRSALQMPAFSSRPASRGLAVKVEAKGKGRKMQQRMTMGMPQTPEMVRREMPVPEIDSENAEFVIFFKPMGYMEGKISVAEGPWTPLSIVKGGQAANYLVKAMETEWGRKLYSRILIKNIASSVYKDQKAIEKTLRNSAPQLKSVKSFKYAMKIRDQNDPKAWSLPTNITDFPPESELGGTAVDSLKAFFNVDNLASMFGGSSSSESKSA